MVAIDLQFREPHTLPERQKYAPFRRAGLPTDTPEWPITSLHGLLWRPQGAFFPYSIMLLNEVIKGTRRACGVRSTKIEGVCLELLEKTTFYV